MSALSSCRLCTRRCKEMLPIFSPETMANRIMWVSQLKISRDDGLPSEICRDCSLSVDSAYQFKELCWTSDEELRKHGAHQHAGERLTSADNDRLRPQCKPPRAAPFHDVEVKVEIKDEPPAAPWDITNGICDNPPEVFETEVVETSPYEEVVCCDDTNAVDKKYACAICGEAFKKMFAFVMHMKAHIPDVLKDSFDGDAIDMNAGDFGPGSNEASATFSCAICHATYKSKKLFISHIQMHDRKAKEENHDARGVSSKQSGQSYSCAICFESFKLKQAFISHIQAVHSREKHHHHARSTSASSLSPAARNVAFSCPVCGAVFEKKSAFAVHFRRHATDAAAANDDDNNGYSERDRTFTCAICEASYKHKSSFISHIRLHTTEKRYECPDCQKRFTSHSDLTRHYRCHTGEKPFHCGVCSKPFARQDHLAKHGRTHTGYKPYTCDECDAAFSEKKSLASHLRTHSGEKPYECDACCKTFARLENYTSHRRTHGAVKSFRCLYCPKAFVEKRGMQRHMKKNHAGRPLNR